ncbi:hypothetical protein [Marinobacter xestospongiae]|uniref:Uncharacterized protein n=1 Tax=Marinobacter xestospongiae TaxID=994319 RepID=A0ABU3W3F3_9GAMM|nr:hypothetical protein [Marinobacter xestospongiae]MDV2081073.1 hypothetical protein [Marinobacter xestospongiae]
MSLAPSYIDYDKNAYEVAYEFEKKNGIEINENTQCASINADVPGCKFAKHLVVTNESLIELAEVLVKGLFVTAIATLIVGGTLHAVSHNK